MMVAQLNRVGLVPRSNLHAVINGVPVRISSTSYMGVQESPFERDPFKPGVEGEIRASGTDFEVVRLDNGKKIGFSGLLPHLIHKWGFYEGKGTHYRMDPEEIATFFNVVKKPAD